MFYFAIEQPKHYLMYALKATHILGLFYSSTSTRSTRCYMGHIYARGSIQCLCNEIDDAPLCRKATLPIGDMVVRPNTMSREYLLVILSKVWLSLVNVVNCTFEAKCYDSFPLHQHKSCKA